MSILLRTPDELADDRFPRHVAKHAAIGAVVAIITQHEVMFCRDRAGWHCLSVHPRQDEIGAQFTYTIGLSESFGHAEIMIFGLNSKVSHGILSDCVEMIRNGTTFRPDMEYQDVTGGDYKVMFKEVRSDCLSEYFGAAVRFYGEKDFRALVMFWPDKGHCFPWQEARSTVQRKALGIIQPVIPADADGQDRRGCA